jgi:tRNA dimethylallyltransferase
VAIREYRPRRPFLAIGLDPGDALPDRITERFDLMMDEGLLSEVASLADRLGRTARQAVGYRELLPVVAGDVDAEVGREAAVRSTLALARRQRTFFRRDPRIRWLPWHHDPGVMIGDALGALEVAWSS